MAEARGLKIYAVNNFELLRSQHECTNQALALKLSDHDYYISRDSDYANPETNFYGAELPVDVTVASIELASTKIGDFLNHNPRPPLSASALQPYYLRLPQIGKAGESKVKTKTGFKMTVDKTNFIDLFTEAQKAMVDLRFTDAEELLKLYISKQKGVASPSDPRNDEAAYELLAEAQLELGELSAAKRHFLKANDISQAAFVALLAGKHQESRHLYYKAPDSIAKRWGLFLCDYLHPQHGQAIESPGFMAFRLFLESTASYMIRNKKDRYLKTLLANHQGLETVFPELRKAIGSAYLGLKQYQRAAEILESAKDNLGHDAELFYKLAEAQIGLADGVAAKSSLKTVLKLLPGHIGSEKLLATLT
jgi:tetratricopeptide (TPR) repeat protein